MRFNHSVFLSFFLGALLFGSRFLFAFTEPSSAPPLNNTPAPLNVSSTGQSKSGGLILNTGGAATGLIVDKGNVGIGIQSPSQKLDVAGYIRAATGLCIGSDCRTSWPSTPAETDPTVQSWAKVPAGIAVYQCPAGHSDPPDDCANRLITSPSCTTLVAFHGHREQITVSCSYVGRLITP